MAYISSFVYCDSIQMQITPQGPKSQIVNPLQILSPVAIPGNYSFSISCTLAGFDASIENDVRIQFVSPSETTLYDTNKVNFKIPSEQLQDGKSATMQFNLDLRNLVFKESGIYTTKIWMNDNLLGEYKIEVKVRE